MHSRRAGQRRNVAWGKVAGFGRAGLRAVAEVLEDRRLLSVGVQGETPFRLVAITGNQQSRLTRFIDETLYEIDISPAAGDPAVLDGFEDIAGNPPVTTLSVVTSIPGETDPLTTTGISQGGGALRVDVPQDSNAYWGFRSSNIIDLLAAGADQLSYDLTLIGRELNGGSYSGADNSFTGYAQSNELAIVFNTGAFIQRNFETGLAVDDTGLSGQWAGQDLKHRITWDLNTFTAGTPEAPLTLAEYIASSGATDARVWFVTQGTEQGSPNANGTQGPMRFYFDDVVVKRAAAPQTFEVLAADFDPLAATKLVTLPFVPDTDAIGYNPQNGLLYRTSGASSYRDDPNRVGYNDNHYMQTVDLSSQPYAQAGVFNANYEGDAATGPYGLPAPRPNWILPAARRTPDQTDPAIGDLTGPGEYSSLRDLTWSAAENVFYGTSDDGIFRLTADGQSTFVGNPLLGAGGPKGITFATVGGETRMLVTERDGPVLWHVDPATGAKGESVVLVHAETELAVRGLVSIVTAPDGTVYGIANDGATPFARDIIRIDPETGLTTRIGSVGMHIADLAILPVTLPVVSEVFVRGADWLGRDDNPATTNFMEYLEAKGLGDDVMGYRLFGAGHAPPATNPHEILPWINMDQLVVKYSSPPTGSGVPTPGSLTVNGVKGAYTVTAVTPVAGDPTAFVLTLNKPLGGGNPATGVAPTVDENGDVITLGVPGGGAAGSNFSLPMNVLQGDTDHLSEGNSHVVLARDYSEVKKKFFKNTASPVDGTDADYSPFYDVDASGNILARDYSEVKKRFFQTLTLPAAAAGETAEVAGITSLLFGAGRIL